MTNFIMPVVSLIAGIISLFVSPDDKRKRWVLIAALFGVTVVTIVLNEMDSSVKARESQWLKNQISWLEETIRNISTDTKETAADLRTLLGSFGVSRERVSAIVSGGHNDSLSVDFVNQALKANVARSELLDQRTYARKAMIAVQYYPKQVDAPTVLDALHKDGFEYRTGVAQNATPTNAIWAGDSVQFDDAKLVALTLSRAGVEFKTIRRFSDGSGIKSKLIEVGSDPSLVQKPSKTVDGIVSMQDFDSR